MRPRDRAELEAPERIARALAAANPNSMPRWFRQQVRENHAADLIKFLVDTAKGDQKFDVPTMSGAVVSVSASPGIRIKAAIAVLEVGLPKQLGISAGEGEGPGGIIALPTWEMEQVQVEQSKLLRAGSAGNGNGNGHHEDVPDEGSEEWEPAPGRE